MTQPVSSSNPCLSHLAESPILLRRGAYLLFAIAAISALAGILSIVGHIDAHPLFSKIPLTAGITLLVLGVAISILVPLFLKIVLGVARDKAHAKLEKEKAEAMAAGTFDPVQYCMEKNYLLTSEHRAT